MAVDDALLESIGQGLSLPVLRLYAWDPPCLSLGYAQKAAEVDRARLLDHGWSLVRRPTGGRAILHTDELTYAVIAPLSEPRLAGSILESYHRLSSALLAALRSLGLNVNSQGLTPTGGAPTGFAPVAGGSSRGKPLANPVCFEVPSAYEITVDGKKLIGSAQARRKDGVLQHGSLPLTGDLSRIVQALVFTNEEERSAAAQRLLARATTVESVLGRPVPFETAAQAFSTAFSQVLNLAWELSELTQPEWERVDALVQEKYANPSWTDHH